jgi:hypothetical protein
MSVDTSRTVPRFLRWSLRRLPDYRPQTISDMRLECPCQGLLIPSLELDLNPAFAGGVSTYRSRWAYLMTASLRRRKTSPQRVNSAGAPLRGEAE